MNHKEMQKERKNIGKCTHTKRIAEKRFQKLPCFFLAIAYQRSTFSKFFGILKDEKGKYFSRVFLHFCVTIIMVEYISKDKAAHQFNLILSCIIWCRRRRCWCDAMTIENAAKIHRSKGTERARAEYLTKTWYKWYTIFITCQC